MNLVFFLLFVLLDMPDQVGGKVEYDDSEKNEDNRQDILDSTDLIA